MSGYQEDFRIRVSDFNLNQFIVIAQIDRGKAVFTYIAVFHNRSFLHDTVSGYHEQVLIVLIILHRDNGRDLFSRIQLEKVNDGRSPGRPACFGDFIGL